MTEQVGKPIETILGIASLDLSALIFLIGVVHKVFKLNRSLSHKAHAIYCFKLGFL